MKPQVHERHVRCLHRSFSLSSGAGCDFNLPDGDFLPSFSHLSGRQLQVYEPQYSTSTYINSEVLLIFMLAVI